MAAATVVIPARYGSTRFPAKILASETGRPLVQHVVDRVRKCSRVREVIVATDDVRIVEALRPFDTKCVITSPAHQSGTDRIAEIARMHDVGEIIVNVQGDEPEIEPEIVDALIERLETSSDDMATAATFFGAEQVADPNYVKVVLSASSHAIYFSRSPIPYVRDRDDRITAPVYLLHLGIYAYRKPFLLEFANWKPTPLEMCEKLEQLRALEHGRSIFVKVVKCATHGIDTPEQYAAFVKRMKGVAGC